MPLNLLFLFSFYCIPGLIYTLQDSHDDHPVTSLESIHTQRDDTVVDHVLISTSTTVSVPHADHPPSHEHDLIATFINSTVPVVPNNADNVPASALTVPSKVTSSYSTTTTTTSPIRTAALLANFVPPSDPVPDTSSSAGIATMPSVSSPAMTSNSAASYSSAAAFLTTDDRQTRSTAVTNLLSAADNSHGTIILTASATVPVQSSSGTILVSTSVTDSHTVTLSDIVPTSAPYATPAVLVTTDHVLSSTAITDNVVSTLADNSHGHADVLASGISGTDSASSITDGSISSTSVLTDATPPPMVDMPTDRPARINLQACVLAERGSNSLIYNYDKSAGAMDLALLYSNEQILAPIDVSLRTVYYDIGKACTEKNHLVAYAMDLVGKGTVCNVYIGLGCAYNLQSLYDVADYYRIPIIACPAAGVGVAADLSEYPVMSRISITHTNTATMFLRFLAYQNYTSLLIIQDQDVSFYQQLSVVTEATFRRLSPKISSASRFQPINSLTVTDTRLSSFLSDSILRSRVYFFLTDANTTRRLMLIAYDLGLTSGDYIFVGVELFASISWGTFTWKFNDNRDQDAMSAYQTLLLFALQPTIDSAYETFEQLTKKASAARATYSYQYRPDEPVDLIVSHFYDSLVYYSSLIRAIHDLGQNIYDISNIIALINGNYSFYSPVHGQVTLDGNGDRISSYIIKNFNPDNGMFESAYTLPALLPTVQFLGSLRWPGRNKLPPNKPRCGYNGKDPICDPKPMSSGSVALAVVIPLLLVIVGGAVGYRFIRKMLDKNSDPYWWRIFTYELTLQKIPSLQSRALSSNRGSNIQSRKSIKAADDTKSAMTDMTAMSSVETGFLLFSRTATYKENIVALRPLPEPLQRMSSALVSELAALKPIQHNNVHIFFGIGVNDENLCQFVVGELCQKGSVMTLIDKKKMKLDWEFKNALMKDICNGMTYLHTTKIVSHGDLSAHTCLIDSRFIVKVTDHGMAYFREAADTVPPSEDDTTREFGKLLWRSPELLRRPMVGGTQKGDVYSYGIILQQLILRSAPFQSATDHLREVEISDDRAKELVLEIQRGAVPPLRPVVPVSSCPVPIHELMEQCWDEHAELRPTFQKVKESLQKNLGKSGENIVDHLIRRMEEYAAELEHEADEKMKQFMEEKQRSEDLLNGMLPKGVSDALRRGQMIYPETYESTTVQFSDINGFAQVLSEAPTPFATIEIMNTLYFTCDHVIETFDVYKVETVGDAYLLVSGLPTRNGIRHAGIMASLALGLRKDVGALTFPSSPEVKLRLRVGIHSGPCVASVIGTKMPRYCLFGDTVNTSSRMESHGEAGKIQLSPTTKELLDTIGDFFVTPRGEISVKAERQSYEPTNQSKEYYVNPEPHLTWQGPNGNVVASCKNFRITGLIFYYHKPCSINAITDLFSFLIIRHNSRRIIQATVTVGMAVLVVLQKSCLNA